MIVEFWNLGVNPITLLKAPVDERVVVKELPKREQYRDNNVYEKKTKGYVLVKSTGRYRATIVVEGKRLVLGTFEKPEQAREAYLNACLKYKR